MEIFRELRTLDALNSLPNKRFIVYRPGGYIPTP
jgi:hypothetical protein